MVHHASDIFATQLRSAGSRLNPYLIAGAASLGAVLLLKSVRNSKEFEPTLRTIPSPAQTELPYLTNDEIKELPYPPAPLPGARDVDSPYGTFRVYEWGPEEGEKVLLIHGISTPSIALTDLAYRLVGRGCRVMLFDLYGRGYSSGPSPVTHQYDGALYATQILSCLYSSSLPWTTCTIVGYSLGGAIAADFISYFPNRVKGLVLVASGGLIRKKHITWKSRLLYSTSGIIPEWFTEKLVARRLWTGPETARTIEPEPDNEDASLNIPQTKGGLRSRAVYTSSHLSLLPSHPNSTVSRVVDWQILHHRGFVPAFISSIRYAPIHDQQHRWRIIAENIRRGVAPLKRVFLVLGETDPIIIADELVEDAREVLGEYVEIRIVKGAGHEVAIDRAPEVAEVVEEVLQGLSLDPNAQR